MKKKITALVLALAMTLGLTQGVFATEPTPEEITNEKLQAEIQARTEEMYNLVYEQLVAQDAVDMIDIYMDRLSEEIEFEVMVEYSDGIMPYSNMSYYFPYGGKACCTEKATGTSIVEVYLDPENAFEYIINEDSLKLSDLGEMVAGSLPFVGSVVSVILNIQTLVNKSNVQSIKTCNGYARIMTSYNPDTGKKSSILTGWSGHAMSRKYDTDKYETFETDFYSETHPLGWERTPFYTN